MKKLISFELFVLRKAFDSVLHYICEKVKATNLDPYLIKWMIDLLIDRKQRVDGEETEYVDITRGVPQGRVLGPF